MHSFREPFRLFRDLFLLIFRKSRKLIVFRADKHRDRRLPAQRTQVSCGREKVLHELALLKPLVCLYHSRILFSVDFLVKSNMKRMATASLDTSGSMETNSR